MKTLIVDCRCYCYVLKAAGVEVGLLVVGTTAGSSKVTDTTVAVAKTGAAATTTAGFGRTKEATSGRVKSLSTESRILAFCSRARTEFCTFSDRLNVSSEGEKLNVLRARSVRVDHSDSEVCFSRARERAGLDKTGVRKLRARTRRTVFGLSTVIISFLVSTTGAET